MNNIYDEPLLNVQSNPTVEKYGTVYRLEARYKKGTQTYYTFKSAGSQRIIVVPQFILEFIEFRKKLEKIGKSANYETVRRRLRMLMELEEEDELESETSSTGKMNTLSGLYRDIGVTLNFENGELRLLPEFTIRQNNIFGTDIRVQVGGDEN